MDSIRRCAALHPSTEALCIIQNAALRCVAPPMGAAALTLPTGTQLAVASLSRRQVLDLGVEVDAAGGGAKASAALRGDAVRWAHFTVALGGAQPSAETPGLAATRLMLAGKNASAANRTAGSAARAGAGMTHGLPARDLCRPVYGASPTNKLSLLVC